MNFSNFRQPYVDEAINNGAVVAFSSENTPGLIPDVVAMQSDLLQQETALAKAFIDAWFSAQAWWLAHPTKGNEIIANRTNQTTQSISLKGIKLLNLKENQNVFRSKNQTGLNYIIDVYNEFYLGQGIISKPVDGHVILDDRLIK